MKLGRSDEIVLQGSMKFSVFVMNGGDKTYSLNTIAISPLARKSNTVQTSNDLIHLLCKLFNEAIKERKLQVIF